MGEIARWNGHKFEVTPSVIRSFTGLNIKGSSKTEDKESGGQGYVSRKQGQPKEISLTAHLSAQLGCDVQTEAMSFVNQATSGSKDYFYIGSKKLLTCSLMLTEASVSEIGITNGGKWVKADVKLTFKQCSKNDGSTGGSGGGGGGGGGSNKTSVKKKSTTTTKKTTTTNVLQKVADGIKTAATTVVNKVKDTVTKVKNALTGKTTTQSPLAKAVSTAVTKIKSVVSAAKAVTTQKKTTTTKSTGGGGGGKRVNMVK